MNANYSEDVEMRDVSEDEEEEEVDAELDAELGMLGSAHVCLDLTSFTEASDEEDEEIVEDEEGLPAALTTRGDKNSQLTVGYKGDRSYVVRGNNIGVFSNAGNDVKYYATISKVMTPKGKEFKPKQVSNCESMLYALSLMSG